MITLLQLRTICLYAPKNLDVFVPYLNGTMQRYGIDTSKRIAAFIAQIAHESGQFKYVREIASGKAYEGRKDLGNVIQGDGVKYKGRGLIQITGRVNYKAISKDLGIDFENNPTLLETPHYAMLSAGWYWDRKQLNKFADLPDDWRSDTKKYTPFQYITYLINGGLNGYEDRLDLYNRALKNL